VIQFYINLQSIVNVCHLPVQDEQRGSEQMI